MNSETKEWLMQYPRFRECSIQTFNDQDKNEKSQSRILTMTDENLEKCEKLQEMLPYGIYFSVNPMESGKRNKESVKAIQTFICDIDSGTKEEQTELINKAPLKPTFVVESVHGFHLYYIADNELSQEEFEEGNMGIRDYYNGDVKVCKDIARVLRIPGFYHMKGEKVMVKWRKDLSGGGLFSVEEIKKAFPKKEEEKKEIEIKPFERKWSGSDSYWERVNQLSNKQMLYELSGTRWVDGEIIGFKPNGDGTEQITINGVARSCWIDKNGMIGSYDNGGPCRPQWLTYYKKRDLTKEEWSDLAKWLNANHPELEDKKEKKKFSIKNVEAKPLDVKKGYLYADEVFDDFECFMSGELVTIIAESNSGKTTFAMDLITRNDSKGRKGCYINLEFDISNVRKDKWLWFHGKTKINLTDLSPLSESEKEDMDRYVKENVGKFDSHSEPNGIDLEDLEELIVNKAKQGYELFIIDSFSRIHGNLGKDSRGMQNRCMEELQELVQKLNIAIVMLHHTNRSGTREGSQKIMDLSNVFILIQKEEDECGDEYRKYILSKDKFVSNREINASYDRGKYISLNKPF